MYLSCLLINTGSDPDRERPARNWLRNLYRVHQRLSMAFPSSEYKAVDPLFVQPYDPTKFSQNLDSGQKRSTDGGFLFRVDHRSNGPTVILVQSAIIPDWDYAFQSLNHPDKPETSFFAAPPQVRPFETQFKQGSQLRFRLLANPTKKVDAADKSLRTDPTRTAPLTRKQLDGRRVPVPDDKLVSWLERRAAASGFQVRRIDSLVPGYILALNNKENGAGARFRSALYDGVLSVDDPTAFRQAVIQGIGPAKAFGFGLLSVAVIP
jgi:CRISPR system Cascade subunit CasE